MPFAHPVIFVLGLAAVAVPILIHLLNRRRFRVVDWAAMRFLLESLRRNRRRVRFEDLLLLAVRCVLLIVLAAALARFGGCGGAPAPPVARGPTATVYVLDDSYSMAQRYGDATLLARATAALAAEIEQLPDSRQSAIVLAARPRREEPFLPLGFVTAAESLAARIRAVEPSDLRADLPAALNEAADLLSDAPADEKRVVLLSDFRRTDLAADASGPGGALRGAFQRLRAGGVKIAAWDYARAGRDNLTIEDVRLVDRFALAGAPARAAVRVRNHGRRPIGPVELQPHLLLPAPDGREEVALPVEMIESIAPGEAATVEVRFTPPAAGSLVLRVDTPADELAPDNRAWLALSSREAVRVLVVDGNLDPAEPARSESFFFVLAIDPDGTGRWGNRPDVISPAALPDARLEDYDVVVWMDVPDLPPAVGADGRTVYPELEELERWVQAGGGLAVFLGPNVSRPFYNGPLHRGGQGLSPLALGPRVGNPSGDEDFFRLDPTAFAADPIVEVFTGESGALARAIRFFAFVTTEPWSPTTGDTEPPRVLARFDDPGNAPAIVAHEFGLGRVAVFYTTVSRRWTDWPIDEQGTYLDLMNDLLLALARPEGQGRTAPVGSPIVLELSPGGVPGVEALPARDLEAILRTPLHPRRPEVRLEPGADDTGEGRATYQRTDAAGVYTLTLRRTGEPPARGKPPRTAETVLYARNVDPAEGDLTPGGRDGLAAALGPGADFDYRAPGGAPETQSETEAPPSTGLWIWLALGAVVLLAAETYLAQRFGHHPAPPNARRHRS